VRSSDEYILSQKRVLHSGFQLANVVEAVMAGCKVPLPYSRGLPAAVQASATATPVTQHIRKHMARQLADICSDPIWQRHLEQVCHTEACAPADAAAPQHIADNKGNASPVKLSLLLLAKLAMPLDTSSPILQSQQYLP